MLHGLKRKTGFERKSAGIARVILPSGVDRDVYVKKCYDNSTLSILSRDSMDVNHKVEVDRSVLKEIRFPKNYKRLGSTVVWVKIPFHDKPIIVGILNSNNELTQMEENSFSFRKTGDKGTVYIEGTTTNKARIDMSVYSPTGDGGEMSIKIGNSSRTGEFNVVINGSFRIEGVKSSQSWSESYELVLWDGNEDNPKTIETRTNEEIESRIKETTSGHKYNEEEYVIGDGESTAVMAEALEAFQHSVLDELGKSTVTTSIGTQPLLNAAQIIALKQKTTDFFSKYLKIQ
jgi:hypothetical protein